MKKILKTLLFITSFVFLISSVDAAGGSCMQILHKNGELGELTWKVPTYVCSFTQQDRLADSGCSIATHAEAKSRCEGTWQHPCSGEISESGKCSDETICFCLEVDYELITYESYECGSCHPEYDEKGKEIGCSYHNCCRKKTENGPKMLGTGACAQGYSAIMALLTEFENQKKQEAENGSCYSSEHGSQNDGKYTRKSAKYVFRVQYPVYTCDASNSTIEVVDGIKEYRYCTDSMANEGTDCLIDAYCVNPDEKVPVPETPPGSANHPGVQVYDIDATKCKNSYGTVDCGYANIMIEGNYRNKILNQSVYGEYGVIMTALRLWSVHVGATGFNEPGFGEVDESTGTTTGTDHENFWLVFVPSPDGSWSNYYKAVYEKLLYTATYRTHIPEPASRKAFYEDLFKMDTTIDGLGQLKPGPNGSTEIGVLSGGDGKYLYAFQLFINTIQGNDEMQEHLLALNKKAYGPTEGNPGDNKQPDSTNDPISSTTQIVEGENVVRVTYTLREDVEIDCNSKDPDEAIRLGCEMKQEIIIKDAAGNELKGEADAYDYCKKNLCFKEYKFDYSGTLKCNEIQKLVVKAQSYKNCGANSVKKYISCSEPAKTQMMVSFEEDPKCFSTENELQEISNYLQCDMCDDQTEFVAESCAIDGVNGAKSEDNPNNVFTSNKGIHATRKEKYVMNYAKDPSLNCILHKNAYESESVDQHGRAYYDYSDMFGVNTNVCKIYCSDSVRYYLPAREQVNSSLSLKFDIRSRVFGDNAMYDSSKALTTVVMAQRDCVSKIFYEQTFDYNNILDIEYGVGNKQLLDHFKSFYRMDAGAANSALSAIQNACGNEVTNVKTLICRLDYLSKTENDRKELVNSLLYDLYNCNMYTADQTRSMSDNKINKPKDSDPKNAIDYARELLGNTNTYCNGDESKGIPGHDCVTGSIRYEGGTQYFVDSDIDANNNKYDEFGKYAGEKGDVPTLSTDVIKVYNDLEIKYCKDGADATKNCFPGKVNVDGEDKYVDMLENAKTVSNSGTISNVVGTLSIPTNDYVVFNFKVEGQLYNSTKFFTEPYSGNVRNETEENSTRYSEKYLKLNDYIYPVSSIAKNVCANTTDPLYSIGLSDSDLSKYCDINYAFEVPLITTYNDTKSDVGYKIIFDRKISKDGLYNGLLKTNNDYYCNYEIVDPYSSLEDDQFEGFVFKNIDINDPFPTGMTDRIYSNWSWIYDECDNDDSSELEADTKYCDYNKDDKDNYIIKPKVEYYKNHIKKTVSEIENSGDSYLYATDEYLEYSYKINNESIKAIREDNKEKGYFTNPYGCKPTYWGVNEDGVNCSSLDPNKIEDQEKLATCAKLYLECNSEFLDELHSSDNKFNVEVIKEDGISKYTSKIEGGVE